MLLIEQYHGFYIGETKNGFYGYQSKTEDYIHRDGSIRPCDTPFYSGYFPTIELLKLTIDTYYPQPYPRICKPFEIYFSDLHAVAQEALLEAWRTTEDEENWDINPLAVIERK